MTYCCSGVSLNPSRAWKTAKLFTYWTSPCWTSRPMWYFSPRKSVERVKKNRSMKIRDKEVTHVMHLKPLPVLQ